MKPQVYEIKIQTFFRDLKILSFFVFLLTNCPTIAYKLAYYAFLFLAT